MNQETFAAGCTYIVQPGKDRCGVIVLSPAGVPGVHCAAFNLGALRQIIRMLRRRGVVRGLCDNNRQAQRSNQAAA